MNKIKKLLKENNINYFTEDELTYHRRWDRHITPPDSKINNIKHTILLADTIREQWGDSVSVFSAYRSPDYNKLVGGADKSQHIQFKAMDLSPANGEIEKFIEMVRYIVAGARVAGLEVGLGIYDSFVHIDTCARNRSW